MNNRAVIEPQGTQSDAAYAALHRDILSGRLAPGAKIVIGEVALKYGFSPGAVREALSRLSAEWMAVATAQKGYSVADVSASELLDLTNTRIAIEQMCLRAAIERGDIEWESAIVAAYHRLHRIPMAAADDSRRLNPDWTAAHSAFHAALADGCGSAWMLTVRAMLYAQAERYRNLSKALAPEVRDVDSEHKAIMDACLSRAADRAGRLIEAHLNTTARIVLAALDAAG